MISGETYLLRISSGNRYLALVIIMRYAMSMRYLRVNNKKEKDTNLIQRKCIKNNNERKRKDITYVYNH